MAEGIILPVVAGVLTKLASAAFKEIAFKEIALIYGAKEDFAKLKDTFSAMQAGLLDAEQKAELNQSVKDWLGKLKDAAYDADDLLDELSYETLRRQVISRDKIAKQVRIFFSKHNQLVFRAKMAHKIKKLTQRLELIAANRTQFQFLETIPDQSRTKDREDTHSFVLEEEVIGRDKEKEEIVKRLLEINEKQNVSVDAIVGVGGLGKTVLAQSVFNHTRVEDAFDLRLWVCVSEIFDLKIIVEKIIEEATKKKPSELQMNSLQSELRKEIDGKKYLLVMDDLWNEDGERWANLKRLLKGGAKGSKILITTRTKLVAEVSEATSPYILDGLSESNSWILFKQMAFKEGEEPESPNMIEIGKEIARKCIGVPLVIRTIGRLLYFKISEAEWLSFKNNELSTITQQKEEITRVLKLSYNHLPSHLKPCFAYCTLFPKDHEFEKDILIKLWVAEGFVQAQGENECLEDVGNRYFMELIWRSIFQDVQRNKYGDVKRCKMHDLMRDLAQLVAGTECFTSDSDIKNVNERTRRVSFDYGGESKWSALFTSQLKPYKLRTFLSSQLDETDIRLEAHISSLKSLRVLDLPHLSMRKVPFSIGILNHLRFLNLSGNNKIELLPSSITKLHNLQTLNISHCASLKELPRDIGSLVNLRHLDLSGNFSIKRLPNSIDKLQKLQLLNLRHCISLIELPRDVSNLVNLKHLNIKYCDGLRDMSLGLNKLTGLRRMNLYVVGPSVSYEDSELWQLNTLVNIRGRLHIRCLHHLRKDSSQANTVNLKNNHEVRDLKLKWMEIDYNPNGIDRDFVVLEKLHPNENVETLGICGYSGVRLSSWVSSLSNLTKIEIKNCKRLQYVPRFDRLPNLQKLDLENLNRIEYMDNNETVDEFHLSVFFPSLQSLTLKGMDKLKGWWKSREFTPKDPGPSFLLPSFHCLSHLKIVDCPQMVSIPPPNSSLKTLRLAFVSAELFKREQIVSASPKDDRQREALDDRDDLHSSFQHLTALHSLHIEYCYDLVMLPDWIGNLTSLEELKIEYCQKLTLLPESIRQLSSLRSLTIDGCRRLEGLSKIGNLTSLQELSITNCHDLVMLPDWIGNLTSLEKLKIGYCPKLTLLPEGIRQLSSLRKLTITSCCRLEDWAKIVNLTSLQELDITYCEDLVMLPDWISNLTSLQELTITYCPKLTLLSEGIRQLSSLRKLTITDCSRLEDWSKIVNLTSLQELSITDYEDLVMLPDWIGNLTSLQELTIASCPKLTLLPEGIRQLSSLRKLTIFRCGRLEKRCRPQIGKDWSKIAHVKDIKIGL